MALLKGELQDDLGNVLYPVTSYDVIVGDVNSKEISDANLCLKNGKYMLVKTNTPTNDLYCIDVIQHNDNFLTQTAQLFATSNGTYADVKVYVRNKSEGRWTDWKEIATTQTLNINTANGFYGAWTTSHEQILCAEIVGNIVHIRAIIEVKDSMSDVKINASPLPNPAKDWWVVCSILNSADSFNFYLGWDGNIYCKTGGFTGIFQIDFTYRKGE